MKKDQLKMANNFMAIRLIYTKPINSKSAGLIDIKGRKLASKDNYVDHRFRAMAVAVPAEYSNGGIMYPCEVSVGDVVLLPGNPLKVDQYVIVEGEVLPIVRCSDIYGHFSPTEEQTAGYEFLDAEEDTAPMPITQTMAEA